MLDIQAKHSGEHERQLLNLRGHLPPGCCLRAGSQAQPPGEPPGVTHPSGESRQRRGQHGVRSDSDADCLAVALHAPETVKRARWPRFR